MQERKDGDYVEYSDFKKYLEGIAEGLEDVAGLTLDTSDNEELRIMANEIRKGESMKIVTCERCNGQNDRGDYANWCSRCARERFNARKSEQDRRNKEFDNNMINRPR